MEEPDITLEEIWGLGIENELAIIHIDPKQSYQIKGNTLLHPFSLKLGHLHI